MITRLCDDIYQITLPQRLGIPVNAYYLKDVNTLIDSGINELASWKTLCHDLNTVKRDIKNIKTVLITHHHIDHSGGLQYMKNKKVYAPKGLEYYSTSSYLSDIENVLSRYKLSPKFYASIKSQLKNEALKNNSNLDYISKLVIPDMNVIPLQGHSSNDYIYVYKDKYIFSGDIILPKIFFNCIYDLNPENGNVLKEQRRLYKNELEIIAALGTKNKVFFLGHGEGKINSEKILKFISQNKRRMERTERKIKKIINQGDNAIESIVNKAFDSFIKYNLFLPFSEANCILNDLGEAKIEN